MQNRDGLLNGKESTQFGKRLLPRVLDELAQNEPGRVYATVALSSDISKGFRDVTVKEVAQAVNNMAWWIEERIGRSTSFETLAYMGVTDLRYAVLFLAAVKCGYKILFPSIRNSTAMNVSLLDQTKCTKFFYPSAVALMIHKLQAEKKDLRGFEVPSFDDILGAGEKPYPFTKKFAEAEWDPIMILHSSGSTGPPKPITMNHGTFSVADNDRNLPEVNGRKNQNFALYNFNGGGKFFSPFPIFHLAGVTSLCVIPIFSTSATVVMGPADRPPNGHLLDQIMQKFDLHGLFCPPSILEQLVQEPGSLDRIKKLDFIVNAGGPLATATGDALSKCTDVCQCYGQTETGMVQALVPSRENWSYLEFHPLYGADMQLSDDNAYELVLHRDPSLRHIRSLGYNFPDDEEWHTRDLFRPHPENPTLWRFHGRTDDIIVLSNGEKFNPVPMEAVILGNPLVSGALIVGQGRFQSALVVETKQPPENTEQLVEELWPTVEKANAVGPGHARITRSKIAIASPSKPFIRAGKGTVVRGQTGMAYKAEIDQLYQEDGLRTDAPELASSQDLGAITEFVDSCVRKSFSPLGLEPDSDLYTLGLDSVTTVEIAARIKTGLSKHHSGPDLSWFSSKTLYPYPTIEMLSRLLYQRLNKSEEATQNDIHESRATRMANFVDKYANVFSSGSIDSKGGSRTSDITVVLTGSTGSLGRQLLQVLLQDPGVSKIICLNRSADVRKRHEMDFAEHGVKLLLEESKVEFLEADFAKERFGLAPGKYTELLDSVDAIIHSAWKVDFNHSLVSFEGQIRGVQSFAKWSLESKRHPHILFISSISSASNWTAVHGSDTVVPEVPLSDYEVAHILGYGESKHVAERLLGIAAEKAKVPATILRVGQIAGPLTANGRPWNEAEWLPALVKTSKSLGMIPDQLPDVDWIPVDSLAQVIVDILHNRLQTNEPEIYNIVNPQQTSWSSIISPLQEAFGAHTIPLSEWISKLKSCNFDSKDELASKPSLKILDFYEEMLAGRGGSGVGLKCDTSHGTAASSTMAGLEPIRPENMKLWLEQWGFK